ncbi:MAG: class I SAM-dependent methyltransferase [Proteobacteria bacterium]|nr:class I SAM-dependent methyltransferase [Pseudomonadota bacterium]
MSRKSLQLTDQVYDYLLSVSLREPRILKECRDETSIHPLANMQIAPEQGQFFSFLIQILHVKKAIEIGVFTGYSSLSIAMALPEDGHLDACDIDPEMAAIAQQYWEKANVAEKITLRIGPAIDTLDKLIEANQENSYDFAFIDAHKPEYIEYYERLLRLIKPGGAILVDNVLWSGKPADDEKQDEDTVAIRQFNKHLLNDERVFISMLPVADGITLVMKN